MTRLNIVSSLHNPPAQGVAFGFLEAYAPTPGAVVFMTSAGPASLRIMELAYESGSPGMFLFEGTGWMTAERVVPEPGYTAYYNANTGVGWVEFKD